MSFQAAFGTLERGIAAYRAAKTDTTKSHVLNDLILSRLNEIHGHDAEPPSAAELISSTNTAVNISETFHDIRIDSINTLLATICIIDKTAFQNGLRNVVFLEHTMKDKIEVFEDAFNWRAARGDFKEKRDDVVEAEQQLEKAFEDTKLKVLDALMVFEFARDAIMTLRGLEDDRERLGLDEQRSDAEIEEDRTLIKNAEHDSAELEKILTHTLI